MVGDRAKGRGQSGVRDNIIPAGRPPAGRHCGWLMRFLAALFGLLLTATLALAQDYPARPITLVVPYAAGGGNDVIARTVTARMSTQLGQQIVVENRGGAGGTIATVRSPKASRMATRY
jgi:tripartite-type tricarboxylate transporter receptor subunit TctC